MADSIDLDNDGIADLLFESLELTNSAYNLVAQTTILSGNLQFTSVLVTDSDYLCSYEIGDTLFNWFYDYDPVSCYNNSEIQIIDRSKYEVSSMMIGDTIFFLDSDQFFTGVKGSGWTLGSMDSTLASMEYVANRTGYQFVYDHRCIWSDVGERYLAFRIEKDSTLKYGWIRLEVKEYRMIKIYEVVCFLKE